MRTLVISALLVSLLSFSAFAQPAPTPAGEKAKHAAILTPAAPSELAAMTLAAHGGERLRSIKSLSMRGSVGVTTSAITQEIPATFSMIFAGERYRFDLLNPFQPVRQAFDGKVTSSNIQNGFELPPINRLGFFMLSRIGDPSFPVTALPAGNKRRSGFRITSPEGFYTDYYIDDKTHQLKGYESSYEINGKVVTTSAEIDRYVTVEGLIVPERFAQRFDLGQFTAYANFKVRDVTVNGEIADDVFNIGK
jgi:hypothetical protein